MVRLFCEWSEHHFFWYLETFIYSCRRTTPWEWIMFDDVFQTDKILYRLLWSLSYNQRRALLNVPILVVLSASRSLFISALVLSTCSFEVALMYLIHSICRYKVNEHFAVAVYRCNINIAFVLQMWRAESLKAGAGSRSKAAKPRPHHPRLSATMLWARGEWVLLQREE